MKFTNYENGVELSFDDNDLAGMTEDEIFDALTSSYDGSLESVIKCIGKTAKILSRLDRYVVFRAMSPTDGLVLQGVVTGIASDGKNLMVTFLNENGDEAEANFGLETLTVKKFVFDQKTYRIAAAIKFDGINEEDNLPVMSLLVFDDYDDDKDNSIFQDGNLTVIR